jgi:hypothetical protein
MRALALATLLSLTAPQSFAAELRVDPALAFSEAYTAALRAASAQVGGEFVSVQGRTGIERRKHIANHVGDYEVTMRVSGERSARCTINLLILRESGQNHRADYVLEVDEARSQATVARIERVSCI